MYITDRAYAKINLTLDITGRREDGYHTVKSVMHMVTLYDHVSINQTTGGEIKLKSNCSFLPVTEKNLAVKAALLFYKESGLENPGIDINIKKNIPIGAGMAGGSTDGAAVLRMLNRMHKMPFKRAELLALGGTLGADVPFCIGGKAALAQGIGERLTTIKTMPRCHILICKPPFSVSTKMAYELFDQLIAPFHPDTSAMLGAINAGALAEICQSLGNSMEQSIFGKRPQIGEIKAQMLELGAGGSLMSGSGSSVFGIFDDLEKAQAAEKVFKTKYKDVFLVKPV